MTLPELAALYYDDPLGFVLDCIEGSESIDKWQSDFLADLGAAVKQRAFNLETLDPVEPIRFSVASGHGIGKSTLISFVFWWIMVTRQNCKGRVTANTGKQLEITTWAEIRMWGKRCRFSSWFEMQSEKIFHKENKEGWFAVPITCSPENSEAFAGQHNRESTSFYLFDESSLIPDVIWEIADAGLTDGEPMFFAFGNPTRNTGKFYEACFGSWQHRWNARSIDSRTCKFPNHDLHDQWIADYGIDSDYVKTRILGRPPATGEDQLIGRELVEGAQQRSVEALEDDPLIAGVDVPDGGAAWFVIRFRRGLDSRPGPRIPAPIRHAGSKIDRPSMIAICAELLESESPNRRISAMFVDSAFGAAIVERLKSLGYKQVHEVSFGGQSPDKRYFNMRAYMWGFKLKDWLGKGAIDPNDKKLARDLMAPGFHMKVGGDGALVVEAKDSIRDHYSDSIDDADALALTFARAVASAPPPKRNGVQPIHRARYAPFG